MLRMAFFILLLANLALLLWYTQVTPHAAGADIPQVSAEKRLVLLEEHQRRQAAPERPALPDIELAQAETTSPAAASCHTIGPFTELDRAKGISDRIRQLGAVVTRRNKTEQEQYGYRVFLPSYKTREEAVVATQKLAKYGVNDYFIITDEEHRNGISLGLFRKKSGAVRRMEQVSRFDFKPQLEIRYRDNTIYWLDYEQTGELVTDSIWREITEETPNLQQLPRDCDVKTI
jgi:hypothetical protein